MKKHDFAIYNGKKIRITDFTYLSSNRAFKYGDGFFESIFSFYENVPLWEYHYIRIKNAFNDYGMYLPAYFNNTYFLNEIVRLLRSNKFFGKVYSRISFFREDNGKYTPQKKSKVSYFIEQQFLGQKKFEINTEGLILGKFTEYRKPINRWSKYKKISADIFVFASIYKETQGFDDVFILNEKGKIIETTNTNIFCLKEDGHIYTPSVESGCVDGVMRRAVIEILKSEGLKIIEVDGLEEKDFSKTEELFLTNAVNGIKWVKAFKNYRFFKKISVELVKKLNEKYFRQQ